MRRWREICAAALGLLAGACVRAAPETARGVPAAEAAYAHVLLISVDGLRPDALGGVGANLSGFARLLAGASTLDARTDPDWTVTLPNHVSMVTGRFVEGPQGHHWRHNDVPPPDLRLRADLPSVFESVAAAGGRCALFAAKEKFVLMTRSWNGTDRASEDGPIHAYAIRADAHEIAAEIRGFWDAAETASRTFAFAHVMECDIAGHAGGWDLAAGSEYMTAVARVSESLTEIFAWLDAHPQRADRTALILTTDHGGGTPFRNHHGEGRAAANFTIPFAIWTGDGAAVGDLYASNTASRARPGGADPRPGAPGPPPIRSADAANLALDLLGLPPLPGATVNAAQDLRWHKGGGRE
jgi:hypothetical protein